MGILGKGEDKRKQDAENLKKCIDNFSNAIKEISFNDEENFDKITYKKFSDKYNEAFNEYIKGDKSKAWFSHTNDVLKEISKKIKKYDNKPILEQTYKEYCNCYRYNPNKRKKDAAIDQESIIGEYSQMVKQLKGKLKYIVKSRKYSDIKTSGKEFDEGSKQKALFEKFKEFDKELDELELDGSYNCISEIFGDVFDENIKGEGKWFSHTNDVFKAINKKLKKFDKLGIDQKTYMKYVECFKYDQKKSSKKAAINDKELFISYQKLYEKILTKLKEYFKYNLSKSEKLEGASRKYEGILKKEKNNIFGTFDIIERMKKCFEGLNDGNTICNLFSQVMLDEDRGGWRFYDSRVNAIQYLEGVQEPVDENIKKVFGRVKVYTEQFIKNRVKAIEKKLKTEIGTTNWILSSGDDFSDKFIGNNLDETYERYSNVTLFSVIETINVTCEGNFTIFVKDNFGGEWEQDKYLKDDEQVYPKLKTINIKGGTLTKIGGNYFDCPTLEEINFNNVEISEDVNLENMQKKFEGATVKINGIEIAQLIKEEKDFSDNLKKDIDYNNDFNLSNWLGGLKVRNSVLKDALAKVEKLKFKSKVNRVTLEKEAFNIDKFKDIEFTNLTEIEFDGNLLGIDEGAFSGKPSKLEKITFTGIYSGIENNVEKLKKMSEIASNAGVTINIKGKQLSEIIEEKEAYKINTNYEGI